jgi:hypothetical protein
MKKKILIPILIISILILGTSQTALAASNDPPATEDFTPRRRVKIGQITEIGEGQLTVKALNGNIYILLIDESTRLMSRDSEAYDYEDLEAGMWIGCRAKLGEDGEITATTIIVLPDTFNPEILPNRRISGKVNSVNTKESLFTLDTREGQSVTIYTDGNTRFAGQVESLAELEDGMLLQIGVKEQEDGALLAIIVWAREYTRDKLGRIMGTVSSIDLSTNTFTIQTRQGEEMTYSVNADTRFISKDKTVEELDDLSDEMTVIIVFSKLEDEDTLAKAVLTADKQDLIGKHAVGIVKEVQVGKNTLTIQTSNGQELTFIITESTRFFSHDQSIDKINKVKKDMHIGVKYVSLENGEFVAKVIMVGEGPSKQ